MPTVDVMFWGQSSAGPPPPSSPSHSAEASAKAGAASSSAVPSLKPTQKFIEMIRTNKPAVAGRSGDLLESVSCHLFVLDRMVGLDLAARLLRRQQRSCPNALNKPRRHQRGHHAHPHRRALRALGDVPLRRLARPGIRRLPGAHREVHRAGRMPSRRCPFRFGPLLPPRSDGPRARWPYCSWGHSRLANFVFARLPDCGHAATAPRR